ncbi:M14 family zinc carboxypeptidase [Flagellimonas flava]|uniref:Zinc carboxypeptidase n=1 Tax=Flagellimonas flava TaxID=570519 RepID=A0A1M5ITV5_9FLAO|nr:M14 family zinc carboxypeptidase [Allomuricauda flava]SHG31605.1 Zinc carboxypeptidase [Allomuricauda flava]
MQKNIFLLIFSLICVLSNAQESITNQLYDTYHTYKETALDKRRIKHHQLQPLLKRYEVNPKFHVEKVGESIEGRDLHLVSIGSGSEDIFLWSQMHGNEPTATQAIFDILNFLDAPEFKAEKQEILSKLKLHFLPMLNPDGAEVYQRRNALGIDINRDALRLQSPEGRALKRIRDSLDAKFGFNLHDQSTYYNAELTDKPATISYLATAFNYDKDINEVRSNAMKVIVYMNGIIQKYAPGQVGRYSDDFEPRAFGDNIAKWGTSLILIESGGYANDREKQEIRKLNYVSILSALYTIAQKSYVDIPIEDYEKIPRNDRKLFDLKIENATYELHGKDYIIDLGIHRQEVDLEGHEQFYYKSIVVDQGDLSTYFGYETFDASGHRIIPAKVYPRAINTNTRNMWNSEGSPFKSGYGYFKTDFLPPIAYTEMPGHFVANNFRVPKFVLQPGVNPTFFLEKEGRLTHAVINGFLIDFSQPIEKQNFGNGLIYR